VKEGCRSYWVFGSILVAQELLRFFLV